MQRWRHASASRRGSARRTTSWPSTCSRVPSHPRLCPPRPRSSTPTGRLRPPLRLLLRTLLPLPPWSAPSQVSSTVPQPPSQLCCWSSRAPFHTLVSTYACLSSSVQPHTDVQQPLQQLCSVLTTSLLQDAPAKRRVKALKRSFPDVTEEHAWVVLQACDQDVGAAKAVRP